MIYNLVSIERVISKVLTDLNLQEDTHRIKDMIEWAGEAMEKIGAFPSLEHVVAGKGGEPLIPIVDYQAVLPMGLHTVSQVAYTETGEEPFVPMRIATGSFDSSRGKTVEDESNPGTYIIEKEPEYTYSFEFDLVYTVSAGYIKTNVREGYLMIAYTKIPTDDNGYPMIPDNVSFMEAIYWYITMKLLYPDWQQGRIRDMVYFDARSSWNYYRKQAYGEAMMPNTDELESIKNAWLRIVPELNEHANFFSTTGQEQIIYNHN